MFLNKKLHISISTLLRSGVLLLLASMVLGCVEEIDLGEELKFEDAIVVEARLTNELKTQVIKLSRTFRFEEDGPQMESNATVIVIENDVNEIRFEETEPGIYESTVPFEAKAEQSYQLRITTNNGRSYLSANTSLTSSIEIEALHALSEINSVGTEVLAIRVDSYDPNGTSHYYRYEYEETYQIIAPNWVQEDFVLRTDADGNLLPIPTFGPRPIEEKVCYSSNSSNAIIQTSTNNLVEDRVSKFAVRTISADNTIISHRYSILVKQFVQSLEAYSYYEVLNQLSGSDNLFSQIQAGFINSNIRSVENKEEKVLGFFEVCSVAEKRLFVNYSDVFPDRDLPPYFENCTTSAPPLADPGGTDFPLAESIEAGTIKYFMENTNQGEFDGPYLVVSRGCGDCTVYGSSEKPDFWID